MADTPASPRRHAALDLRASAGVPWPDDIDDTLALAIDGVGVVAVDDATPRVWRLFFDSPQARDEAALVLRARLGETVRVQAVEVEDEGWATRVQENLRAIRVGRFLIAPPWDVPAPGTTGAPPPGVIVIEPSTGFGTGHHQSTRLCLRLLDSLNLTGRRVIDAGTGSGVLAIAARHRGAREVVAFDVDPDAVGSARANVELNGLDGITVVEGDLATVDADTADLVVANLTMFLLRERRTALARLVDAGGALVVGGFTRDQVELVVDAFPGFSLERRAEEDDWVGLVLRAGVRS